MMLNDVPANASGWISANPGNLPILLILAMTLVAYRTLGASNALEPTRRRQGVLAALTILLFGLLDWAMLAALPRLGLSYGPLGSSLTFFTLGRIIILLLVLTSAYLWKGLQNRREPVREFPARYNAELFVLWALNLGLFACIFYAMFIEPFDLQTTRLHLAGPSSKIDRPLLILHLTDLHVERTTRREIELVQQVNALQPDLILLTGDYPNLDYRRQTRTRQDTKAVIDQLSAPYGVFAVSGSVDTPDILSYLFDGYQARLLRDEIYRLPVGNGEIYLVGVANLGLDRDLATLSRLMEQVPEGAYTILLYHTPDLAREAASLGVDLYLAGHTHGGQVRLPFYGAVFTSSIYGKEYESGLYALGQTTLYVSRGLGMEGLHLPRLRFLCPPEIVLIELSPEVPSD
jgi:predicted MPP superfamily phosphohydrolase